MKIAMQMEIGRDPCVDWERLTQFVVDAERLGVHRVWSAEAWNNDAIGPLGFIAARTSTIELGTGIMQAGTRTPALVAMTAMTMQSLSGGRFKLGLGVSGPQVMEGWHGVPYTKPITRLHEIVDIVRLVSTGARLVYDGELYQLPLVTPEAKAIASQIPPSQVPIYLATLGPKSLELTGAIADGWLGTTFIPEFADLLLDPIKAGAASAGRAIEDIDLQVSVRVELTSSPETALRARRRGLAFQLGAMGSRQRNFYSISLQRTQFADDVVRVQQLWLAGKHEAATDAVPIELVAMTGIIGDRDFIAARVESYRTLGIDTLNVYASGETPAHHLEVLEMMVDLAR